MDGREKIVEAAIALFSERGFSATTMRDIAKEAGVSLGLVTKHFVNKENLHTIADETILNQLHVLSHSIADLPQENFLEKAYDRSADIVSEHRSLYRYIRRSLIDYSPKSEQLFLHYYEEITEIVAHGKKVDAFASDIDTPPLAIITMLLILGPILLEPYIENILGSSIFDAKTLRKRNKLYARMINRGLKVNDNSTNDQSKEHETLEAIQQENDRLRSLLADAMLENYELKRNSEN